MENKEIHLTPEVDIENDEIEIIGVNSICRFCASQNERLIGVYSEEGVSNDLATKINLYLPVKVSINDELPLQCCWNCASTILAWHELVVTCVESDRKFRNSHFVTEKQIIGDVGYDNSGSVPSDDNDGSKDPLRIPTPPPPTSVTPSDGFCSLCNKTMSRGRDLKRHLTTCHGPVPRPKRHRRRKAEITAQFFCDVCEKGFTRKYDMEKHRGRVHAAPPLPTRRSRNAELLERCRRLDTDGKSTYRCDFCDRAFAQSYNLLRHRTVHTGEMAFFCHICGKGFRMSNGLTRHIDTFHRGVRNFACELCKKTFTARAARDEHMNIHTGTRPFVCDVCGKRYKQKASLHVHKIFHTNNFRFQCNNCGKKFRRAQELKVHNWMHTGHRPYSCHHCKAAFRLGHDLKRHLKIHERTKECVCNECGCVFSQERYLKVHKKIHKKPQVEIKVEDQSS